MNIAREQTRIVPLPEADGGAATSIATQETSPGVSVAGLRRTSSSRDLTDPHAALPAQEHTASIRLEDFGLAPSAAAEQEDEEPPPPVVETRPSPGPGAPLRLGTVVIKMPPGLDSGPLPLLLGGGILALVLVAVASLFSGEPRPDRLTLEALYPYGVHGFSGTDGRYAPPVASMAFSFMGEVPCVKSGTAMCLLYEYRSGAFQGSMTVKRNGDTWGRAHDRGMPFLLNVERRGAPSAAMDVPERDRVVFDDDFSPQVSRQ